MVVGAVDGCIGWNTAALPWLSMTIRLGIWTEENGRTYEFSFTLHEGKIDMRANAPAHGQGPSRDRSGLTVSATGAASRAADELESPV